MILLYKRIGYRKCRIDEFVIGFVGWISFRSSKISLGHECRNFGQYYCRNKRNNITNNESDEPANGDRILTHSKNRLILLESVIGFGIGFLGGLVGLVLGSIRMPAMISVLKMETRIAIETNLSGRICNGIIWFDRTYHK